VTAKTELLFFTLQRLETFIPGTLLNMVNGVKVTTLEEFRSVVSKPVLKDGKQYITFQSEQNEFIAMTVSDIIEQVSAHCFTFVTCYAITDKFPFLLVGV